MTLPAGTRVGPYEILASIGAGGMGEVYRARDPKLGRDVAIKILPGIFSGDPDRLARFEREARTLATLNHPNIAQVYGLEQVSEATGNNQPGRVSALVMELVEGEDLAQRLERGAIPLDEALPIARQIADALEAAHERGVIHRDLKPANIKLRPDGVVKVLDFGLAKAMDPTEASNAALMNSPTITSPATQMGMVIGTAAYMAPEQAKGRAVDRRADLWAFGVVLYEMLTGKRAFEGADVSELLVSVLRDDPSHDALPAGTPASIRRLLRRCLEKDRAKRLDSMAAARLDIDDALAAPRDERGAAATTAAPTGLRFALAAAMAAVVLLAAGAAAGWGLKKTPEVDRPLARFAVPWSDGESLNALNLPAVALSRDGRRIVYRTAQGVFVRDLADPETRQIGRLTTIGVWLSPDSEWVLLRTPSGLARVPARGGQVEDLVLAPSTTGAHWVGDGTIIYSTPQQILRIPETGGTPEVLIKAANVTTLLAFPQVLPGGRLLYHEWRAAGGAVEGGTIVSDLDGSNAVTLLKDESARYLPNGFLIYARDGRAHLLPFDAASERITGPAIPVPETVVVSAQTGWAQMDVSANGTAAFISSRTSENRTTLAWTEADGRAAPALSVLRVYSDLRLSPDGRRVAAHLWDEQNDIWVADLTRSTLTRVTFTANEEETPVWSPDGRELAYASDRTPSPRAVVRRAADGGASSTEHVVWQSTDHFHVNDWSADGRTIIVEVRRSGTANDLVAIDVATGKERVLLASSFRERQGRISPDGRWLAFTSDESGRDEVYVQEFPSLARRVTVSTAGGAEPVWSRDGRRLFFRGDGKMLSSSATGPLEFSAPAPVFTDTFGRTQGDTHTHFDVDAAGRFLVITSPSTSRERGQVHVVLNWEQQLKKPER